MHGPNGFLRRFRNDAAGDAVVEPLVDVAIVVAADQRSARVRLSLGNTHDKPLALAVTDAYTKLTRTFVLAPTQQVESIWETDASLRWYDLRISNPADPRYRRQIAGYAETGLDGYSDPAIGNAVALDDTF